MIKKYHSSNLIINEKIGIKCDTYEEANYIIEHFKKYHNRCLSFHGQNEGAYFYPNSSGFNFLNKAGAHYNVVNGIEIISCQQFLEHNNVIDLIQDKWVMVVNNFEEWNDFARWCYKQKNHSHMNYKPYIYPYYCAWDNDGITFNNTNAFRNYKLITYEEFVVNKTSNIKPTNTILKGYKGFSSKLTCIGFQFEKDKTYTHNGEIKLCAKGFHFCKELKDVFTHYANRNGNVFHEIELFEDSKVIEDTNKCVTNKFKVGKRLTTEEIENLCGINYEEKLFKILKEYYVPIQEKNNHIYLGGSAALMVLDLLPYRKCKDLDIVSPFYQNVPEIINNAFNTLGLKPITFGSGCDVKSSVSYKGMNIELFINSTGEYGVYDWKGLKLRINNPHAIVAAKLKYAMAENGNSKIKHMDDIIKIMERLKTL